MNLNKVAGIELETSPDTSELHAYPRETRRGKAQWAIWIRPDGSALVFVGCDQIILPKNSHTNDKHVSKVIEGQIVYQKTDEYPD